MSKAIATAGRKLRVFISHFPNDFDFADQLEKALLYGGFSIAAGRDRILFLDNWQHRLSQLIRDADAVVCVLPASSATSEVCRWELEEAARLAKPIVNVSCYPLDQISLPVQATGIELISFFADRTSPGSGFGAGLQRLGVALSTGVGLRRAADHEQRRGFDHERDEPADLPSRNAETPIGVTTKSRAKLDGPGRSG